MKVSTKKKKQKKKAVNSAGKSYKELVDSGSDIDYTYLIENSLATAAATAFSGGLQLRGSFVTMTIYHRKPFVGSWGDFVAVPALESSCPKKVKQATESWPVYYADIESAVKDTEYWFKEWKIGRAHV